MKKIIALYDSDSIYAARFMEYFQHKQEFEWEVIAFTKKEKLEAYLLEHRIELLLSGSREFLENPFTESVRYSYLLTEELHEANTEQNKIFRYQSIERMMEQLRSDYMRRQDEISVSTNPNRMNLITLFSPVPGDQDMGFAWSLGFQLAKQGKALFLPLEPLSRRLLDFIEPMDMVLSEFIYYLKENSSSLYKWKELLHYNNNLAYLAGVQHGFDLLALNKEDIHRWVELLRTGTDYQNVIFYLPYYQEAGMELLKLSDQVILIKGQFAFEQDVVREWERQMDIIGFDIRNPKFRSVPRSWDRSGAVVYHSLQELMESSVWLQAKEYLNRE